MNDIKDNPYDGYYKYDEKVAQTYDSDRSVEEHWIKENNYVAQYFKVNKIKTLLDLPVGTGRFFSYYRNVDQLTGIDISEAMLEKSRKNIHLLNKSTTVVLKKGDVFNLPFSHNSFECVLVFRLFHLMPENKLEFAIKELCRIGYKDIIVQSYEYVSPSFFQRIKRRVAFEFTKRIKPETMNQYNNNEKNNTPWSHIEAYYHKYGLINYYFNKYNFIKKKEDLLCHYNNLSVFVSVYSKIES